MAKHSGTDDAANPLKGKAPAPDQLKDENAKGEAPNASTPYEARDKNRKRPERYPAVSTAADGDAKAKT